MPKNSSGVLPEREDGGLRAKAERGGVHILSSTDESDGFGNAMRNLGFGAAVIDHDKRASDHKIVGNGGE